jgi:hypothetical protein
MKIEFNTRGARLAYELIQEYEKFDLYQIYIWSRCKKVIKDNGQVISEEIIEGFAPAFKECYFHGYNPIYNGSYEIMTKEPLRRHINREWGSYGSSKIKKEVIV